MYVDEPTHSRVSSLSDIGPQGSSSATFPERTAAAVSEISLRARYSLKKTIPKKTGTPTQPTSTPNAPNSNPM